MSFNYTHYDITIAKTTSDVTVRIVDTKLFRLYQVVHDKITIHNFGIGSLENFYHIVNTCLTALIKYNIQTNGNEIVKTFNVSTEKISINLCMRTNGLVFDVNLDVPFVEETTISSEQIVIQKLQKELEEHKQKYDKFIQKYDDLSKYIELPIYKTTTTDQNSRSFNCVVSLPIICPRIDINYNSQNTTAYVNGCQIYVHQLSYLMPMFMKIQTDELRINGNFPHETTIDLANFPASIKRLNINSNSTLRNLKNLNHMKELVHLEFSSCSELNTIYEAISELPKLTVKLTNCQKFSEVTLLGAKKVNLEIS